MKRIVLEWGLILSAVTAPALFGLWAYSQFVHSASDTFELGTVNTGSGIDRIYLIWAKGDISICNTTHGREDWTFNGRWVVIPPGYRQFTVPGFKARYYPHSPGSSVWWSAKLSLLVPATLALLLAVFLYRRFRGLRPAGPPKPPSALPFITARKRIVLEWGAISSATTGTAALALWGYITFFISSTQCIEVSEHPPRLFIILGDGDLTLCNKIETANTGGAKPSLCVAFSPESVGHRFFDLYLDRDSACIRVIGVDLRYDGYCTGWSVSVPLLILAALASVLAVVLYRKLKRAGHAPPPKPT